MTNKFAQFYETIPFNIVDNIFTQSLKYCTSLHHSSPIHLYSADPAQDMLWSTLLRAQIQWEIDSTRRRCLHPLLFIKIPLQ